MVEPIRTQDDYNLGAIRQLLLAAFTPEEFRRFCQDRPDFRPVVASFGPGHGLVDMVDRVIDYNQTRLLWPEFLDAVREERPRQYARFTGALRTPAGRHHPAPGRATLAQELAAVIGQPLVWVPPGPFFMGSDKARDPQAYDHELPQHTVTLPGYWIGRYPVTVARFKAFVTEGVYGVYNPALARSLQGRDDHPVVRVSWGDAQAYCDWLSERSGQPVALPTEAQWEKAARGTDERIYPWGGGWDPGKCNSYEGGKGGTTPVGAYSPAGDSPYGCADMAGNVWEWCQSLYRVYPYDLRYGREDLLAAGHRVLRGGSFDDHQGDVRCASRFRLDPGSSFSYFGFRLVVAPVPSGL